MKQDIQQTFIARILDASLRRIADAHSDCLHPCVWLVKDENGPLTAGGIPRLPVGQQWPRRNGKPLAYLMAIDAALLPGWSPLPRDAGTLLVFVGGAACQIVVAGPGVETRDVEPPLEEYWCKQPSPGEVLEPTRFRLQEGLHAGIPASWKPENGRPSEFVGDWDLREALCEINDALKPQNHLGRLFGHHEWWSDADAPSITRYSYLDVNGYAEAWYQELDGPVEGLQKELENLKRQPPPDNEEVPAVAETVVQACEKWLAETERLLAKRRESSNPEARRKAQDTLKKMGHRRRYWRKVQAAGGEIANQALVELMRCSLSGHEVETIIREEFAHDPKSLKAALETWENAQAVAAPLYSDLVEAISSLQEASRHSTVEFIRKAWLALEAKLNEYASDLLAHQLFAALTWRLHGYQSILGWLRRGYVDPQRLAEKIAAIQWWQKDPRAHEAELAHWGTLLVMHSENGPYVWGDAGWAIILADHRAVARAELGRLAIAIDVS